MMDACNIYSQHTNRLWLSRLMHIRNVNDYDLIGHTTIANKSAQTNPFLYGKEPLGLPSSFFCATDKPLATHRSSRTACEQYYFAFCCTVNTRISRHAHFSFFNLSRIQPKYKMNWGNFEIKLEPLMSIDLSNFSNFFEEKHSSGNPSTNDRNNNKIVRSKISRSKVMHRKSDEHVDEIKDEPNQNTKKDNCQRYHPYQVNKRSNGDQHNSSSRNQSGKGMFLFNNCVQQISDAHPLNAFEG